MQKEVNQLKNSVTQKESKDCVGRLDASLVKMKQYLEQQHRETISKSEKIENLLDGLSHVIEKVRKELDALRVHYQKNEESAPQGLPAGCVKDIKSKNFAAAGEKLHKISEVEHITAIVKDVYEHKPENFELVLNFADSVGTQKKAFFVYRALMSEMEVDGHEDIYKTLKLIDSLEKKVIHVAEGESGVQEDAQYSVFRMKNKVKLVAAEKIKNAMLHNDAKNEQVLKIAQSIYDFDHLLFENVLRIAVRGIYQEKMPVGKILENIKCYSRIEQLISGYLAVYDVLLETQEANHAGLFPLAEHIKATMEMKGYTEVPHERRCIFEGLKYRLPKSVRNIVFLPKICFKNIHTGEYLFAGGNHTEEKRFVYSWLPSEKDIKDIGIWGTWITTYEHGTFDIYNVHHKEFLYADLAGYDEERRFVFTWSGHKKKLPASSRWFLIPDGDHVPIQNHETHEYLYADSEKKHDVAKHHVFTLKTGKVIKESSWFAENCSEPHL